MYIDKSVEATIVVPSYSVAKLPPSEISNLAALPILDESAYFDCCAVWLSDRESNAVMAFADVLQRAANLCTPKASAQA